MDGFTIKNVLAANRFTSRVFKGCFMNDASSIFHYLGFEIDYAFILNTVINLDQVGRWVVFYKRENVFYFFDSLGKNQVFIMVPLLVSTNYIMVLVKLCWNVVYNMNFPLLVVFMRLYLFIYCRKTVPV